MSPDRDELLRLVQTIPDDQVSRVLADMRQQESLSSRPGVSAWVGVYRDITEQPSYWT